MSARPAYILAAAVEMLIATGVFVGIGYLTVYGQTHNNYAAITAALLVLGGLLNNSWVKFLNSVGVPAVAVQAPTDVPTPRTSGNGPEVT